MKYHGSKMVFTVTEQLLHLLAWIQHWLAESGDLSYTVDKDWGIFQSWSWNWARFGYARISTTDCDQLGSLLLCTWATRVPVLGGLTWLGSKSAMPSFTVPYFGYVEVCKLAASLAGCWVLHWWQTLSKDVHDRCLFFLVFFFFLVVDDDNCTICIYCTSQMVVSKFSNSAFCTEWQEHLFYIHCFYFKNVSVMRVTK